MVAQLRPTRLDVTDRFPMLGFTIRTDAPPRVAEVVIATDPALFTQAEGRSPSTFYSSREHGLLSLPRNDSVYVVPPEVLARFVAADRLWFGLATATPPTATDWTVEVLPTDASPYVSLSGLTDRALRRVRMFPTRRTAEAYSGRGQGAMMQWAGDHAKPGSVPVGQTRQPAPAANGAPAAAPAAAPVPADTPYDDGFGPLPPLAANGGGQQALAEPPASMPAAQAFGRAPAHGFQADPDDKGIDGPVPDYESAAAPAMAFGGGNPPVLSSAEYDGVTRLMPSPNHNSGRRGQAIDRIVIHITGAPQTPHIGTWFTNPQAQASAHYMVDQNGQIIQFVREQDTAWHAGVGAQNRRSIGIEHVAIQQGGARYPRANGTVQTFPYTPPTKVEYRTSAALVAHLCRKYGLTPDRTTIIGHREADPNTTHSVCPDGAWDWDGYMALVAECYAALPVAQGLRFARGFSVDPEAMGIEGPAYSETSAPAPAPVAAGLALGGKDYDRVSRVAASPAFTEGRSGTAIDRIVIHITDAPTTGSTVSHFTRPGANSSAHYLVGQDGEIVQLVSEADTAWHARGANRRSIGIEHVAVKQGGASYGTTTFPHMPPTDTQYCESAALVSYLCQKYGLTPDRSTILGHREADAGTSHTSCPDGAWNWDHFMDLVTNAYCAPQPAAQALGLRGRTSRPAVVALDAGTISVSPDQQPVASPSVETVGDLQALSNLALLTASPALTPILLAARAAAETAGLAVGIGPQAGAGPFAGGGLGHGIILAPGNVMGTFGQGVIDASFVSALGGGVQVTVLRGGLDAFRAVARAAGISGGEGLTGGAAALFNEQREFQGVTLPVGLGAAFSPVDLFTSVQHAVARQLGLAAAAGGGALAQALNAPVETVEIKYRAFIPSPLIKGPASDYDPGRIGLPGLIGGEDFGGDGRGFAYSGGTSRAEIVATVDLAADGSLSNLRTVSRSWGESTAYDSTYTYHVAGKPDWWVEKQAGHTPSRRSTLATSDDNLRVYQGAGTLQRNILAMTSQSSVVTVHCEGALPLVWPTPDIDADISIYLKPGANGPEAMVVGDHDGFPAHELYINGRQVYTYDPVAAGNGPDALVGSGDQEVSTSWIAVPSRVAATAQAFAASRALDADDWSINWDDVQVTPQPTDASCWATAAAMVLGWRDQMSVSPQLIAEYNGLTSSLVTGLAPSDKRAFAQELGLTVHPNACYTADGFRDILEVNGPIWVTAKVPGVHAIVVTGMYRENGRFFVRITDPWDRIVGSPGSPGAYASTHNTGSQYILSYDAFAAEFEAAGHIDRIQLLHSGGTHGHTINRGNAAAAGYAQALSEGKDRAGGTPGGDGFGVGTSLTRARSEKDGARFDLAQLTGFVLPANALAGGAGTRPLPGQNVVLDDWPYIEAPSGRVDAGGVDINFQHQNGGVGNVLIVPLAPRLSDGWTARVQAEIAPGEVTPDRAQLIVRVTTTFSRAGEEDQVGVTEVLLQGNGQTQVEHGASEHQRGSADKPATAPAAPADAPAAALRLHAPAC